MKGIAFLKLLAAALLLLGGIVTGIAFGQSYPAKPVRIVVGVSPGGGTDFVARLLGQKLTDAWGPAVVIENRPGAGGNIAAELTAKAPPDGYTLLVANPSHAASAALYSKPGYDLSKDFAPITQLIAGSYMLLVHPSVPVKTVKEFVALAKRGGLTYASSGSGQLGHLGMELFKTIARFDALHIPYKAGAQAMIAIVGGEVPTHIATMGSGLAAVRAGRVRVLGVTTLKRSALLPDAPTISESGYPGFEINGWYGLLAPAGTPRDIVTKLHNEVTRILKIPDVRERMQTEGADPVGTTPEEFAAYIIAEMAKWAKVIKQSGAKVD